MIGYLEGIVRKVEPDSLLILVGGVGYDVHYVDINPVVEEQLELWIVDIVREDRRDLYGFGDIRMKALFEALINISGVGPKLAQKILRAGNFEMMQKKLLDGDIEGLTAIAGVGKKTAQKIILELKGVLVSEEPVSPQDNDTLEALLMLGYSQKEGLFALKQLTKNSPEERIKEALKYLSHGP